MSKFLVLYHAPVSARDLMAGAPPDQARAGMDAWMEWAAQAGDAIVDLGVPLGDRQTLGDVAGPGDIVGYSILQADSASALRTVLDGHPHLGVPGASIEVLEFLPVPGV